MGRKLYTEDDHYSSKEDRAMLQKAKLAWLAWLIGLPVGLYICWILIAVVLGYFQGCSDWVSNIGKGKPDDKVEAVRSISFVPNDLNNTQGAEKSLLDEFSNGLWHFHFYGEFPRDLKLLRDDSSENRVVLRSRYFHPAPGTRRNHTYEIFLILTKQGSGKISMEMEKSRLATHSNIANIDGDFLNKEFLHSYTGNGVRGLSQKQGRPAWKIEYQHKEQGPRGVLTYKTDKEGDLFLVRSW